MNNPEEYFSRPCEEALVDINNLGLLCWHATFAAHETPLTRALLPPPMRPSRRSRCRDLCEGLPPNLPPDDPRLSIPPPLLMPPNPTTAEDAPYFGTLFRKVIDQLVTEKLCTVCPATKCFRLRQDPPASGLGIRGNPSLESYTVPKPLPIRPSPALLVRPPSLSPSLPAGERTRSQTDDNCCTSPFPPSDAQHRYGRRLCGGDRRRKGRHHGSRGRHRPTPKRAARRGRKKGAVLSRHSLTLTPPG